MGRTEEQFDELLDIIRRDPKMKQNEGGMIAWSVAMAHPEMTDKLIIVNLPHPKGMARELSQNED